MRWTAPVVALLLAGCIDDYPDHLAIIVAERSLEPSPGATASLPWPGAADDKCGDGVRPHYEGDRLHMNGHKPTPKVWLVSQYHPSDYPTLGRDAAAEPAEPVLVPTGLDQGDRFRMWATYDRSVHFAAFAINGTTVHVDGQLLRDGDERKYSAEYAVENGTVQETVTLVFHARHPVKLYPDPCT
jgi:hypothetical protein